MGFSIVIADDHPALASGVRSLLLDMEEVESVDIVHEGRSLIDILRQKTIALVLLDIGMPFPDGITMLQRIKEEFRAVRVIIFTSYDLPSVYEKATDMGADGFVHKSAELYQLKQAIQTVLSGKKWFVPETQAPAQNLSSELNDPLLEKFKLTKREIEIIQLIAKGQSTRQISKNLSLSEFTINAHRRNISHKLNINTPVGLLQFARKNGLAD